MSKRSPNPHLCRPLDHDADTTKVSEIRDIRVMNVELQTTKPPKASPEDGGDHDDNDGGWYKVFYAVNIHTPNGTKRIVVASIKDMGEDPSSVMMERTRDAIHKRKDEFNIDYQLGSGPMYMDKDDFWEYLWVYAENEINKIKINKEAPPGAFVVHTSTGKQFFKQCLQTGFPRLDQDLRSFRERTSNTLQRMWQGVIHMMPLFMQRSKGEQTSNLPQTLPRRRRRIEFYRDDGSMICGHMIESDGEVVFKLKRTENSCNAAPKEDESSERPKKFRRVSSEDKKTVKYRIKLQDGSGSYKWVYE